MLPWAVSAVALYGFGRWSDRLLRQTSRLRVARTLPDCRNTGRGCRRHRSRRSVRQHLRRPSAGITIAVAASMAGNAAYYAVVTDLTPRLAGTAMGIMTIWFAASGFLAPVVTRVCARPDRRLRPGLLADLSVGGIIGCRGHPVPPSGPGSGSPGRIRAMMTRQPKLNCRSSS